MQNNKAFGGTSCVTDVADYIIDVFLNFLSSDNKRKNVSSTMCMK